MTSFYVFAPLALCSILFFKAPGAELYAQNLMKGPSSKGAAAIKASKRDVAFAIPYWSRGTGQYEMGQEVTKSKRGVIDVSQDSLENLRLFDAQYQKQAVYQGTWLNELLVAVAPSDKDTALLHFDNGMIIAIERSTFTRGLTDRDYGLFIADRKLRRDRLGKYRALKHFPPVARQDEVYRDPRPIMFSGNKIVAGDALTGGMKALQEWGFSPWYHASTLKHIEWVKLSAYEAQFTASPTTNPGLQVYLKRCAYCHTVKQVGATYGWDFVHPLPVYERRNIDSLFYRVKYPIYDAIRQGLHMPHQPDFTKQEAQQLWQWLESVSKSRLKPYNP